MKLIIMRDWVYALNVSFVFALGIVTAEIMRSMQ